MDLIQSNLHGAGAWTFTLRVQRDAFASEQVEVLGAQLLSYKDHERRENTILSCLAHPCDQPMASTCSRIDSVIIAVRTSRLRSRMK